MTCSIRHLLGGAVAALILSSPGTAQAHDNDRYYVGECRECQQDVRIRGQNHIVTGTACFQRDGQWNIVSRSFYDRNQRILGPIVILPQRYSQNHYHQHRPTVIYKKPPRVIYKDNSHRGWGYQHPVHQNKKHNNHHWKKSHYNDRDHHNHDRDKNGINVGVRLY